MTAAAVTNIAVDWLERAIWIERSIKVYADQPPKLVITIKSSLLKVEGTLPMTLTITDEQTFEATISAVDSKGNPATFDGDPEWSVSDPAKLNLVVNGLQAVVSAVGPLGACQLRVSVDADLGEGVRNLTGILDVEVIGGEAVAIEIVPSVPHL